MLSLPAVVWIKNQDRYGRNCVIYLFYENGNSFGQVNFFSKLWGVYLLGVHLIGILQGILVSDQNLLVWIG